MEFVTKRLPAVLAVVIAVALALTLAPAQASAADDAKEAPTTYFTDVTNPDAYYFEAVNYMFENGYMNGTDVKPAKFSPAVTLDRAMLATVIWRVAGEPAATKDATFTDIKKGSYYYNAVCWAAENNIVKGTSATKFDPKANISRQDIATMLYRFAKDYMKFDVTKNISDLKGFTDADKVAGYAKESMQWMVGNKVINGVTGTTLAPAANATRGQAATMVYRLIKLMPQVTGVTLIDQADETGLTPVTAPIVGQKLNANVTVVVDGVAKVWFSYYDPKPADLPEFTYNWIVGDDTSFGKESTGTITSDLLGKNVRVEVTAKGYIGKAVWKGTAPVANPAPVVPTSL